MAAHPRVGVGERLPDHVRRQPPEAAEDDWAPSYMDYLYLSFTNSTALSPTDTMPLTALAKGLMLIQALASLLTIALVVSRAVSILH